MSRTIHTIPAFPRALRGPRGGHHTAPTPCAECVSFTSCRPGACSAPYGCESWVDEDGRRVDVLADLEPQPDDLAALDTPDPDDLDPYQPSPATLAEMSGIFPTDTNDPEPDNSGFTFESMGGLIKGKCGAPKPESDDPEARRITEADARKILAAQPVKSFPYLDTDDPGPLFRGPASN